MWFSYYVVRVEPWTRWETERGCVHQLRKDKLGTGTQEGSTTAVEVTKVNAVTPGGHGIQGKIKGRPWETQDLRASEASDHKGGRGDLGREVREVSRHRRGEPQGREGGGQGHRLRDGGGLGAGWSHKCD